MSDELWLFTPARRKLLLFIQAYYEEHGVWPTRWEMARHMSFKSVGGLHHHLRILRAGGAVTWEPYVSRTVRVLKPARPWKGARK